ncbi:MAG: hypothetical protein J0H29_11220 [Sphingobacteriales bacterium]|nr:hypothetical protein [Sphingobacteriales bacterium]OJY90331.1 MAG: hypothetical protein BGP14_11715 [Sphingobacteriales bacterium 44-15]
MKKLLVILAIGAFAACNNASETPAESTVDSPKVEAPAEPAAPAAADTTTVKPDSTAAAADTTKK